MAATAIHQSGQVSVQVPVEDAMLGGDLVVPDGAFGAVIFAHGSGSSRHSRRNQFVARVLQHAGIATLLMGMGVSFTASHITCSCGSIPKTSSAISTERPVLLPSVFNTSSFIMRSQLLSKNPLLREHYHEQQLNSGLQKFLLLSGSSLSPCRFPFFRPCAFL